MHICVKTQPERKTGQSNRRKAFSTTALKTQQAQDKKSLRVSRKANSPRQKKSQGKPKKAKKSHKKEMLLNE